jgi:hypothetical protein
MPGRVGPRFAIEALFLIALAVGSAYADLAGKWIAVVMAGGWLVVALLELTADRIWAAAPPWRRPYYVPVSPPRAEAAPVEPAPAAAEPKREVEPEPQREPTPAPQAEAVTMIAPPAEPATAAPAEPALEAESDSEPELEPEPAAPEHDRPKLEPLDPAPKRRWFRRRGPEPAAAEVPEIEMPKHVRLLPATERTDRSNEVAELFDVPESEERSHT